MLYGLIVDSRFHVSGDRFGAFGTLKCGLVLIYYIRYANMHPNGTWVPWLPRTKPLISFSFMRTVINQRIRHTPNYGLEDEMLWMWIVQNLSPRGSKGKVFKIKRTD